MSDKIICTGLGCPIKTTCMRYMGIPDMPNLIKIDPIPYDHEKRKCEFLRKEGVGQEGDRKAGKETG